jgi:hypothetical protein
MLMVSREVTRDASAAEFGGESSQEMRYSGSELDRDVVTIGFPSGAEEELFRIPLFVEVCEEHLGVDVSAETFGASRKFLGPRRVLRLNAEVESEAKEGAIVCRGGAEGTEVMASKISGASGQEEGG